MNTKIQIQFVAFKGASPSPLLQLLIFALKNFSNSIDKSVFLILYESIWQKREIIQGLTKYDIWLTTCLEKYNPFKSIYNQVNVFISYYFQFISWYIPSTFVKFEERKYFLLIADRKIAGEEKNWKNERVIFILW